MANAGTKTEFCPFLTLRPRPRHANCTWSIWSIIWDTLHHQFLEELQKLKSSKEDLQMAVTHSSNDMHAETRVLKQIRRWQGLIWKFLTQHQTNWPWNLKQPWCVQWKWATDIIDNFSAEVESCGEEKVFWIKKCLQVRGEAGGGKTVCTRLSRDGFEK